MMARRTDGGEGRLHLAFHHCLDAGDHGAGGAAHGLGAALAHHGVAVDMDMLAGSGTDAEDRLDIFLGMYARQLFHRGGGGGNADQAGKGRIVERRQHGAQPVGPFGMIRAGVVLEERRMADQQRRHAFSLSTQNLAINRPLNTCTGPRTAL